MSFSLNPSKPVHKAVRSAARKQVQKAIKGLTGQAGLDVDEAAHDARKRCKKLRGLVRLVRDDLGKKAYRTENAALRDAARNLSQVRDAAVLSATLDGLVAPTADGPGVPAEPVAGLRALLAKDHRELHRNLEEGASVGEAVALLEQVAGRVPRWPLHDGGWGSLGAGMEDTYRRGRDQMAAAYTASQGDETEHFHQWRKQVKYLRYQLGLVRAAWPGVLDAMEETADKLGELLGEEHDLAVLADRATAERATGDTTQRQLLELIARRRAELRAQAEPIGRRLYADKPALFARRLGRLWQLAA